MVSEDFEVGDLVWAKMKTYPPWPARIEDPSPKVKPPKNKKAHFVYFFGSKNYAWILDENISPHSESFLNASQNKKKSSALQEAIDEFIKEFSEKKEKPSSPKTKKKNQNEDSPTKVMNSVTKKHEKKSLKSPHKATKRSFVDMNGDSGTYSSKSPKLNEFYPVSKVHSLLTDYSSWDDTSEEMYLKCLAGQKGLNRKHVKPSNRKFGFIGLGHMGEAIVRNMLDSGHDVTVWNKTITKYLALEKFGAKKAKTPSDLVIECDVIFCCVSDPEASKALFFGEHGILKGLEEAEKLNMGRKGYVEMTSIDPETSLGFNEAIAMRQGLYLEAPLCGTSKDAEEGTLLIVASGDRRIFTLCETCFHAIGKHAFYLTCQVGYSSKMTLILSMFTGALCVSAAEAMVLAEKLNLPKEHYLNLLRFWPLRAEKILSLTEKILCMKIKKDEQSEKMNDHSSLALMPFQHIQRDLNFALIWANEFSQPMRVTAAANEVYKFAKLKKHPDNGNSAECKDMQQ